ncbi:MAG: DUF1036 domain-containing protein [Chryseobacterium sp.]|nr:MAG: DUF1036 domain-containing protein [Chryseobacterium sp.]
MRKIYSALVIFLLSYLSPSAQVIFKNEGFSKIYVAYGYRDVRTGWTTKGWFPIGPGEEKPVYDYSSSTNPNFYYCATIEKCDQGYFGQHVLYVNSQQPFTIPNADKAANYSSPLMRTYQFNLVNLAGTSTHTIVLKPVNLTCGGLRQGKWRLALDKYGDYAEKREDEAMYREITFDRGKPVGWCKDFYADGKPRAEFKLLSIKPLVYDGHCIWYREDGTKEREEDYDNGVVLSTKEYSGTETKVSKARLEVVKLPLQSFFLNGTGNELLLDGKSRTTYPIALPKGTVEWYYEFSASRNKEDMASYTQLFSLAGQLTKLIDKTGLVSAGIGMLTAPPGGDICNVYLLDGSYDAFREKQPKFSFWAAGSRTNFKSGIVELKGNSLTNPVIGIDNPSFSYGIHVSIQVVAVVSKLD